MRSKLCLLGIPDHQGVIHVRGRLGAAQGPAAFRQVFQKFSGKVFTPAQIEDSGDLDPVTADVSKNHRAAAHRISEIHRTSDYSIVVGGGHDHGFSQLLGIAEALREKFPKLRLGCINIDAHLDVRKSEPQITSGSPFYLAIENGVIEPRDFIEFGIQSHCNSPELWDYIQKKKVSVVPFSKLRHGKAVPLFQKSLKKLASSCNAIVVSFDLDAVAAAYAPGVSAPQAEGFTASEVIEMSEIAGRTKKVVSWGIFELNPEHDIDQITARLAATTAYHFAESKILGTGC